MEVVQSFLLVKGFFAVTVPSSRLMLYKFSSILKFALARCFYSSLYEGVFFVLVFHQMINLVFWFYLIVSDFFFSNFSFVLLCKVVTVFKRVFLLSVYRFKEREFGIRRKYVVAACWHTKDERKFKTETLSNGSIYFPNVCLQLCV